jgi:hypothetical protein
MADRYSPVKLSTSRGTSVRCASNRKYAAAQLVPKPGPTYAGIVLKVYARSDSAQALAERIRKEPGWTYVFELKEGRLLWENSASEWLAAENVILNYAATQEV